MKANAVIRLSVTFSAPHLHIARYSVFYWKWKRKTGGREGERKGEASEWKDCAEDLIWGVLSLAARQQSCMNSMCRAMKLCMNRSDCSSFLMPLSRSRSSFIKRGVDLIYWFEKSMGLCMYRRTALFILHIKLHTYPHTSTNPHHHLTLTQSCWIIRPPSRGSSTVWFTFPHTAETSAD